MNPVTHLLYILSVSLIRLYKRLELQLFKLLFTPWLKRKGKEMAAGIGVVLHCPGETTLLEPGEHEDLVSKCRYDKLVHIRVNSDEYFARMASGGNLASGEMYVEGLWEGVRGADDVVEFAKRVLENDLMDHYWHPLNRLLQHVEHSWFNLQTRERAFQVGEEHYDLGNDLYELMLDPWMQYTCGYWARAQDLNQAQESKLELIGKKLDLKRGMRVLDIGCGFGTLCKYLALNYGVECVGVTISEEQAKYGRMINKGLDVEIRLQDYRDVNETFDRVVSIGCLEHIGVKNYGEFFSKARSCLRDDTGIFLLHSIGLSHSNFPRSEPWLAKYIFPNGQLPRPMDIARHTDRLFVLEDWHNFSLDYAKTLNAWRSNFATNWSQLAPKYGKSNSFKNMWEFYLATCEAGFLSRRVQLWQLVLSKHGLQTGYRAAR